MNQIHHSLSQCYQKDRIIFWYDPDQEWKDDFESFDDSSVDKIVINNNEFGTKVRVLSAPDPLAKFLIYSEKPRPVDESNWLLDLILQGHEFKADRASLNLQELGLPYDFLNLFDEHAAFFRSERRKDILKTLITKDDQEDDLKLKMMAVIMGTAPETDAMLLKFLEQGVETPMLDPVVEKFDSFGLTGYFWSDIAKRYGYKPELPSLRDFAITLFRAANPLDDQAQLHSHAFVFMQRWKDSHKHSHSFIDWSHQLAQELRVSEKLSETEALDLRSSDTFELFDKFEIHSMASDFDHPGADDRIKATILQRRQSFWYNQHKHGYQALLQAVLLRELIAKADLSIDSFDGGLKRYTSTWWKVDQAYRRCIFHLRSYNQATVMKPLDDWIGGAYVNQFLLPLADHWSDTVAKLDTWSSEDLPPQRDFYHGQVKPYLDKNQKIFVIVSDALRYEAAQGFAEKLDEENRFTTTTTALLASLPSYTQLGMASLLPGSELSIDADKCTVSIDGQETSGLANRNKILNAAHAGKATAIKSEDFLALNTKIEGRELMRNHELVYIYHNTIDKTGDEASTERQTVDAVERAYDELTNIVKKITNINASNILVTADHGFLFQQHETHVSDDTPIPTSGTITNTNRRFVLGHELESSPGIKMFSASQLGLNSSFSVAFPNSLGRFPLKGSGKRFVHGGFSLQEVVVPVIHINKKRDDDTGQVDIEIMRAPAKITTGRLNISLYQEKPVSSKLHPREIQVGVYTSDGKIISDMKTCQCDSKEDEARLRETPIDLVLSHSADEYNNQMVELRLTSRVSGSNHEVTYKSHPIKLQKPFASDFDV